MSLHPATPPEMRTDPVAYARWRVEHHDREEARGLSDEEMLDFFQAEFFDKVEWEESPERIVLEDAEILATHAPPAPKDASDS